MLGDFVAVEETRIQVPWTVEVNMSQTQHAGFATGVSGMLVIYNLSPTWCKFYLFKLI